MLGVVDELVLGDGGGGDAGVGLEGGGCGSADTGGGDCTGGRGDEGDAAAGGTVVGDGAALSGGRALRLGEDGITPVVGPVVRAQFDPFRKGIVTVSLLIPGTLHMRRGVCKSKGLD